MIFATMRRLGAGEGGLAQHGYTFGRFHLSPSQGRLERDGQPVALGTRAMAILGLLAEKAPMVVGNREIMDAVWPGIFVEEANIRVHVASLRRALGEEHGIVNHPGQGYSLSVPVRRQADQAPMSLPLPSRILLGRGEDLDALRESLASSRLTTIIGPGGIGKTSMALAVAQALGPGLSDGVCFVDLSPLSRPALVTSQVAAACNTPVGDPDSPAELAAALAKRRMLLILDNCEHVLDGVAPLLEALQAGAEGLCVLATSREPLRAEGEHLYRLAPLALPPREGAGTEDAAQAPAMRLLADRAARNDPPCRIRPEDLPLAIRLCHALDGIPLAIELAAARLSHLSLEALVEDLARHLTTPEPGCDAMQDRHRTLVATLDWSYRLLPPAERSLLQRLGIFRGFFTLVGVSAAGSAGADAGVEASEGAPMTPVEAQEALVELVDKSLVMVELIGGQPWYRLLDTMRHYARSKLLAGPWHPHLARCHAQRVSIRLAELATPRSLPPEQRQAENSRLLDDLGAALDWAFSPGADAGVGIQLTAASGQFFMQMSMVSEYRRQAGRALAALAADPQPGPVAEMRLLGTLGTAIYHADGPTDAVLDAHSRALALAERLGDTAARRRSLWGVWLYHFGRGRYADALPYADAYRGCTPVEEDPLHVGERCTAMTLTYLGRFDRGRHYAESVLRRAMPQGGNVVGGFQFEPRAVTRALLARLLWLQGSADQAREVARESLDETKASGHALSLCFSLTLSHCFIAWMIGDAASLESGAALLVATARQSALSLWLRHGEIYAHAARVMRGERPAVDPDFLGSRRWDPAHVEIMAVLGIGHAAPDALARFTDGPPIWLTPEVLRLEAEACAGHDPVRAAALLDRAAVVAAEQGSIAWALRIAISRARLCDLTGDATGGRAALQALLPRFTEGFDTADLTAAHRLLQRGVLAAE
jgi:predicted ATPase/DNA-binding winged helix-turn-helix (wHTH) protein